MRERILEAALEAMALKGYHGTSMRDIASRVGCSVSTLYDFYPAKGNLLNILIDDIVSVLNQQVAQELAEAAPNPVDRLRAAVRAHVRVHAARPAESFLAASEIRSLEPTERDLYMKQRDSYESIFRVTVEEGVEAGFFATPFPVESTRAILTMSTAVASWYRSSGDLTADEVAERYAELALAVAMWTGAEPTAKKRGRKT